MVIVGGVDYSGEGAIHRRGAGVELFGFRTTWNQNGIQIDPLPIPGTDGANNGS